MITEEQNKKLLRKIEGEELQCRCGGELEEDDEECPSCGEETEMSKAQKEKEKIIDILDRRDELLKNKNYNSNELIAEAMLDEKKQNWINTHKCPDCFYQCHHHTSKRGHSYWICNACGSTYNDDGRFQFDWGFD